jgi:hypothetical protein
MACSSLLLPKFAEIEFRVGFKFFNAWFTTELDLLSVIDTHDGVAH